MLFKIGRLNAGENWAEKVACEICTLLQLPHAHYEFAKHRNQSGVVSETFVPKGARLILGNELLGHIYTGYDKKITYKSSQYTVRRVMAVIENTDINLPINCNRKDLENAADVFVGYLMLDALISNQDRHHENWGLIVTEKGLYLAPTYDHASSLGRNETDENRRNRLQTRDIGYSVESYVKRAKSALYKSPTSNKPLTTMDAFREAAKIKPDAYKYWLSVLEKIDLPSYSEIFAQIPEKLISQFGTQFALKILELNTVRLLEGNN